MVNRRILGWVAVLIACVTVASCTTSVAGQPRPAPNSATQPGGEPARTPKPPDRDPLAVTLALRRLDACALFDLNAVKASGNPQAMLLPIGPHACMISPTSDYSPGDHGVEVSVGDGANTLYTFDGKPVTIGGAKAYELRDYHSSSKRCELFFPVSFTRGITFSYDVFDNVDTCQVLNGVAGASVPKLRNPDTLTVDPARRPFAVWDGCSFLARLLGPDAQNYTYKPDGTPDPFSGCETTKKRDGKTPGKDTPIASPALEITYDKPPKAPNPTRTIGSKVAEVHDYHTSGCALSWNQADSGAGNEWYSALMIKLTAATCDSAAQLAEKAITLAGQAPPDASGQPLRNLLYAPQDNDSGAVGACVDFGADPSHTDCEPYHPASVPQGTTAILAAAKANRNVQCAVFADSVSALYGKTMSPLTWGAHCFFVEPTHTLQLRVNVDPDNAPGDYGQDPSIYSDRRETQIAGKPAVTFWDKSKSHFDVYLSPFGDLTRKGNVHITAEAEHGRGDSSIFTVKLDQSKADAAIQVITRITQKYFAGG